MRGKLSWLIAVKLWHKVTGIHRETIIFVELLRVTPPTILEEPETISKMLTLMFSMLGIVSPDYTAHGPRSPVLWHTRHQSHTFPSYIETLDLTIIPCSNQGDGGLHCASFCSHFLITLMSHRLLLRLSLNDIARELLSRLPRRQLLLLVLHTSCLVMMN